MGENNTGMIVGVVVAILVLIGGVWFVMSGDDDSSDDTAQTTNLSEDTSRDQEDTDAETTVPAENIVELAQATDSLSTLVTAVVEADLVDTLSGGEFTVFAPTNDAFAALPEGTLDDLLLPENQSQLVDVLTYHVVPSAAFAGDLSDGMMLTTVQGEQLEVGISDDGTVTINDATVVTADVAASNGVVHVIDTVLLP